MKSTPDGWPRITSAVFYDDAAAAIDWLVHAFGFKVRMKVEGPGGRIEHSELEFGDDGLIIVGAAGGGHRAVPLPTKSPRSLAGANSQVLCLYVDDVDAHCQHARAAGAVIAEEPTDVDYGPEHWADRNYRAVDPEGHHWWFMRRLR